MATIMLAEILLLFVVGACAIKTNIDISQNENNIKEEHKCNCGHCNCKDK